MPTIFIPSMMRKLSDGADRVEVAGRTLREVIDDLESQHPGFKPSIVEDGRIRSGLALAVNGVTQSGGLTVAVPEDGEVHILPAIAGGAR